MTWKCKILLVLLAVMASTEGAGARNLQCFNVYYVQTGYNYQITGYGYECFETVNVTGDTVYVDTATGGWGPSIIDFPNQPPFPPEEVGGGSSGQVTISAADIANNSVVVQLSGSSNGGILTLTAIGLDPVS